MTRKAARRHKAIKFVTVGNGATVFAGTLLGESTVESHADYVNAGEAEAFGLQASASATAGAAHVYIDSHNAARTLIVGLYSAGATGHPGSLLSAGSIATVRGGAWNTVTLTPSPLVGGRTYWLAILGKRGTLRYRDRDNGPCPSETSAQTTLGSLPARWQTGTTYPSCPASAYITAAESVLGPPTPVEPPPTPVEPPLTPVEPPSAAPTDMALPAISGAPMQGQVLSAGNGAWTGSPTSYAHQWQHCDAAGSSCTSVSGATGASYALTSTDTGHTMRVKVTASNPGGSSSASSMPTALVAATPPPPAPPTASFTYAPTAPVVGQSVAFDASSSTCPNGPCTYEWSDDGSPTRPIVPLLTLGSGQTLSSTFLETGTKYVRLVVTDASGQTATVEHNVVVEASSPPPPPPPPVAPSNTALPTIGGTTVVGDVLTASDGTWTGSPPMSYSYQWQACNTSGESCSDIGGATTSSYTLTVSDVGHTLRVVVSASNAGGSTPASSAATNVVSAVQSAGLLVGSSTVQTNGDTSSAGSAEAFQYTAPASGTVHSLSLYVNSGSTAPAIVVGLYSDVSGNPGTLLASATIGSPAVGAWNPVGVPPVAVSSGSVYWLAALAPSGTLAIRDMANGGGGPTRSSASGSLNGLPSSWSSGASWANSPASFYASGVVVSAPPAPTNTVLPSVSGSALEGQTLSASNGTWSGSPTSYAYQWEDCNSSGASCANVSGATGSSYRLLAGDIGHTVRVVVTASNGGGSTSASSAATAIVAAAPPPAAPVNTALPTVGGSAAEGLTLSASNGGWTESPTSYAYQWEDCNAAGEGCSTIGGATASTRVLASSDVGHTLRVVVRATNSGGMGEAVSPASSLVTVKEAKAGNLEPNLTATGCFENPEEIKEGTVGRIEACNYPGPNNTGPGGEGMAKCASYKTESPPEGKFEANIPNHEYKELNIKGYIEIGASNVTINDVCVENGGPGEGEGATVTLPSTVYTGTRIENSVLRGNGVAAGSVHNAVENVAMNSPVTLVRDRIENCSECIHDGGTAEETYIYANGAPGKRTEHYEDVYSYERNFTAKSDTIINPENQTDTLFVTGPSGCGLTPIVTKSLQAGGDEINYFCGEVTYTNNRIARCVHQSVEGESGGHYCNPGSDSNRFAGTDANGLFPYGGYFGVHYDAAGTTYNWTGNFWDDNREKVEP